MMDDLVNNFRLPVQRAVVIHNPLDVNVVRRLAAKDYCDSIQPLPDRPFFVACGRLVDVKGFDLLIKAFSECAEIEIDLCIIGRGPEEANLKHLVQVLGLDARVKFLGHHKNPFCIFAKAEAFILSSKYEGFPNAVLEALACGLPVIALPAPGGTVEILGNIPGCVVAGGMTSDALAAAIKSWKLAPPKKIDRKFVEKYELKKIAKEYERLFHTNSAMN